MEVLTSDYRIDSIVPSTDTVLDQHRAYLWIWHADKIPPHIGISSGGVYFSLKSSGKDISLPLTGVLILIERKKIKTLAVELKGSIDVDSLARIFDTFDTAEENQATCLTPIKEVLNRSLPTKLAYLLSDLDSDNEIQRYIGFNLDDSFKGIPYYTTEDIHRRLALLARAE